MRTYSDLTESEGSGFESLSVSGQMPWVGISNSYANGIVSSHNFRRAFAVRSVVETVGPVAGRFYAKLIREWGEHWLSDASVLRIDDWGNPLRWPGILLGTGRAFSPTTLRYLATALWLERTGRVSTGSEIVEIGVGFGGLAAMNALVSQAVTTMVDLPEVEGAALRMLGENKLCDYGITSAGREGLQSHLLISNYAFTELNEDLQERYFETCLRHAEHGVIISNAGIFSAGIQGRDDSRLLAWLRDGGLDAKIESNNELLSPCDYACNNKLIYW